MSLTPCRECTRLISTLAETCPGCGAPLKNPVYNQLPKVGDTFDGIITEIKEFGAFVEFMPGQQGLLHISEISWKRLETMEGIFNKGDIVKVKLVAQDPNSGKFKLSHKQTIPRIL